MLRHLDLFSGIGGFALAASWTGKVETIGFCEIEEYPRRVLAKNFPGVPIHDDIHTLTGAIVAGWGGCDLITGGFPCQPFSLAGHRRGNDDDRALWPEMARVIAECRPAYVLAENVPGFISVALDETLAHLESIGYAARAVAVPAVATDALHIRERVWIMAHCDSERERQPPVSRNRFGVRAWDGSEDRLAPNSYEGGRRTRKFDLQAGQSDVARSSGSDDDAYSLGRLCPSDEVRAGWNTPFGTGGDGADSASLLGGSIGRHESHRDVPGHESAADSDHSGCEEQWLRIPDGAQQLAAQCGGWWPPEPPVRRMAHGIPHRVDRLRGLGNAIVPQVAYELLSVMLADEEVAA